MAQEDNPTKFEEFLLSEYSNIVQAHFKSIETISAFFKHYLLIMSVPISAIAVLSQIGLANQDLTNIIAKYEVPISMVLFCISLISLGMFCYIINLRLDTILYARVVNGVRKYFYDAGGTDINLKLRLRVLPQSPQLPCYLEASFFMPVVLVFALMNTLYCFLGSYILFADHPWLRIYIFYVGHPLFWIFLVCAFFFAMHIVIYFLYTRHREIGYLKSNILGVDIDGVLNKHREQFCSLLYVKTGKRIEPDKITIMPVHEHPGLGVRREDERQVFNEPKYWIEMPVIEDAAEILKKLNNILKLEICIFTHRPWPDSELKSTLTEYKRKFLDECSRLSFKDSLLRRIAPNKTEPLRQITREWLVKYGFLYHKLFFEKGNDYCSDPRGQFKNRFYIAKKKKIRFFVEDDIEKAIKLSYICDVVFLFSHPYNEPNDNLAADINNLRKTLPGNVIRVKNWLEINQQIRRLS